MSDCEELVGVSYRLCNIMRWASVKMISSYSWFSWFCYRGEL